ncbi:MAG: exodeoxyribonuclease VII large subunit [Deltaproteobacteria bacterium]|nr:exodeoxyribonuclease VII large subunit [Deltaproteobacteria bacterium]
MEIPRYTVGALTRAIRDLLEAGFGRVRVEGEISRFTAHRSGHWYLELADDEAVLNAVMFARVNRLLSWQPQVGDRVVATGSLDVYPPSGRYNLVVQGLARAGAGDAAARLEALKRKLAAEGLFDPARKRPLPPLPRAVGVATSPTGAALHDILRVAGQRFCGLPVILSPCRVQGEGAAAEIAHALGLLVRHGVADVIIVGRGGGSAEDLSAFDDEALVRAVAACPVPVVSAVGHEVDVSLCDLAADVRAATPSHAAEIVVPDRTGLSDGVDALAEALAAAARRRLERLARDVDVLEGRLQAADPRRRLGQARQRCDEFDARLVAAARRLLERRRALLEARGGRLAALSPLAVLDRGYAVAFKHGAAVRQAADLVPGDTLSIRFASGSASASVTDVEG